LKDQLLLRGPKYSEQGKFFAQKAMSLIGADTYHIIIMVLDIQGCCPSTLINNITSELKEKAYL
jgi:hypothetical protein